MPGEMVFIGLGGNLGDPRANLWQALKGLRRLPGYQHQAVSSLYRTAPVGKTDQPEFYNAVARGQYSGQPQELLGALLDLEADLGRVRLEKWGPRLIDLDLLLFGRQRVSEPNLEVPHPQMAQRAFVLVPLDELCPELKLPGWNKTAAQLLAALDPSQRAVQNVERVSWA